MTHHQDRRDAGEKFDDATGVPSPWYRPMVVVPVVVAVVLLLWGVLGTGWLL
jgi:hypothetical protein